MMAEMDRLGFIDPFIHSCTAGLSSSNKKMMTLPVTVFPEQGAGGFLKSRTPLEPPTQFETD